MAKPVRARRAKTLKPIETRTFWEVDALRGVAITMMVIFHFMYDLSFFRLSDAVFTVPFWHYFQRTTASTFILLVGLSLTLSYNRARSREAMANLWPKFLKRGARIFGWGLLISTVTYFALGPETYIQFGILHFIGFSAAMAYPFLRLGWPNLLVAALFFAGGAYLQGRTYDLPWLVWLGFEPANHFYVDFFAVIPWFGVVLVGIFLGNSLYPGGRRALALPDLSSWMGIRWLCALGRRSLPIYLLHQPILYALFILAALGLGVGSFSLF